MKCAWQAYINLLPVWMRQSVDRTGRETLLEARLRINRKPELITRNGTLYLDRAVSGEDLRFCVNVASHYSPWAATTSAKGYITAPGGHRIGMCGTAVTNGGIMTGMRSLTSLCLRVSRDFTGISVYAAHAHESVLIIGRPGSGKTTFLRDLIRQRSDICQETVAVVDEREEIFPSTNEGFCFSTGKHTDILAGCRKEEGITAALRSMNPNVIAVDEITAEEDCRAMVHAGWCGVRLIATAHAGSREDLFQRPMYQPIIESKLFDSLVILQPDKSWRAERMYL